MKEFLWSQKYRPTKVSEAILPERLKKIFQTYVDEKKIPNLLLSGNPGIGKTTLAIAMCQELGINYMIINASSERGIDTLRNKVISYASTVSWDGSGKVIILDEADALTAEAQDALKGILEEFSSNVTFILTCNRKAKLIEAIHSRTAHIDFKLNASEKPQMAMEFGERCISILDAESVQYDKDAINQIVIKFFPDYRRTLNELQMLSKMGDLDLSILSKLSDIKNLKELMNFLKNKDFSQMRKWVSYNSDNDPSTIYRRIYDSMYDYLKPESIPSVVIIIAKYMFQTAFASDPEISLVACLTEIMVESEFK